MTVVCLDTFPLAHLGASGVLKIIGKTYCANLFDTQLAFFLTAISYFSTNSLLKNNNNYCQSQTTTSPTISP
jgi:hypothetical protein